jgi:hypothetical protein
MKILALALGLLTACAAAPIATQPAVATPTVTAAPTATPIVTLAPSPTASPEEEARPTPRASASTPMPTASPTPGPNDLTGASIMANRDIVHGDLIRILNEAYGSETTIVVAVNRNGILTWRCIASDTEYAANPVTAKWACAGIFEP